MKWTKRISIIIVSIIIFLGNGNYNSVFAKEQKKLDGQDLKFILLCCEEIKENGLVFFEHDKASIEEFERFASETDINTFEIHDQNDYILYLKLRDWNYETREDFWKRYLIKLDDFDITLKYENTKVKIYFEPKNKNVRGGDYSFIFDLDGNLLEKKFGA